MNVHQRAQRPQGTTTLCFRCQRGTPTVASTPSGVPDTCGDCDADIRELANLSLRSQVDLDDVPPGPDGERDDDCPEDIDADEADALAALGILRRIVDVVVDEFAEVDPQLVLAALNLYGGHVAVTAGVDLPTYVAATCEAYQAAPANEWMVRK